VLGSVDSFLAGKTRHGFTAEMKLSHQQVKSRMSEIGSVDELLNKAFELAYFILGDRAASIYVAMAAMDKLKVASTNQGRRLYYTPTGRSAYPAARTKVNLNELHLLQRLVFIESELFERLLEGQGKDLQQDDLIIRYIKHLVRITTKHNSFYVTLGLCRLLYNYSTADASEIYNLALQDPERIRDDYYYRSRKQRLMQEIKGRFGNLIKTERGLRREERFQSQEDSQRFVVLVNECLNRFTPWHSACVLPTRIEPKVNVITSLLFVGDDPDQEHEIEMNRIHSLIHPECLGRLTTALGLPLPNERIDLPLFHLSSVDSWPNDDRFKPASLTEGELDAIRHYLDKNSVHRKQYSQTELSLLVDGRRHSEFELQPASEINFSLADGAELIEVRSQYSLEDTGDIPLALALMNYDQSGVRSSNPSLLLASGQRLALRVSPATDPSGAAYGATLRIGYESKTAHGAFFRATQQIANRVQGLIVTLTLRGPSPAKLALALLLVAMSAIGLWAYLHSRTSSNSPRLAKLQVQDGNKEHPGSSQPTAEGGRAQTDESEPERNGRVAQHTASPTGAPSANDSDRLRGTKPRPASVALPLVKRVFVDSLGDDPFGQQLREQLIAGLKTSDRLVLVSNRADADAVFRGSATAGETPSIVLELVNAGGQTIWSFSPGKGGSTLSANPSEAALSILRALLQAINQAERKR
jgi:hypothetical protein